MQDKAIKVNDKARFVNVATALGDTEDAVEKLLPFFQSMLEYRNTMNAVKYIEMKNETQLLEGSEERGDKRRLNKLNAAIKNLAPWFSAHPEWQIYARRVIQSDAGRLPGQLFSPQPWFLPLRIAAPPRVGKSATALFVASLAKRLKMKVMYSVAPKKLVPISELTQKLERLGWVGKTATGSDTVQMEFHALPIQDVQRLCSPDLKKLDMVMYSSEVASDIHRAGALLANWRLTETLVFHLRDEAQTLVFKEENIFKDFKDDDGTDKADKADKKTIACHKFDLPPGIESTWLRRYYGNAYGLNCNITATHFPTLLEEEMWGFIGSTRQNVQAYLDPSASKKAIDGRFGSKFLPTVVPALMPPIPSGYMGVERLRTWKRVHLQRGMITAMSRTAIAEARAVQPNDNSSPGAPTVRRSARNAARNTPAQQIKDAKTEPAVLLQEDAEYEPSEDEDNADGDEYTPDGEKGSSSTSVSNEDKKKAAQKDLRSIESHFKDWVSKEAEPIKDLRSKTQADSLVDEPADQWIVPMYIGALNTKISDTGMASFVKYFGNIVHKSKDGNKDGVAFLLYSSVIKTKEDLDLAEIKYDKNDPDVMINVGEEGKAASALLAIYDPKNNKGKKDPVFHCRGVQDAAVGAVYALEKFGITRVAILGYGMLQAGLTVQSTIEHSGKTHHYCPRYVALATADTAALDAQLQIAGRAFVDIKGVVAPDMWTIELLGVKNMVETLKQYSAMEDRLAKGKVVQESANRQLGRVAGMPMYEVLRTAFTSDFMITNSVNSIGVLSTRKVDFGSILGLTAAKARDAAQSAKLARENPGSEEPGGSEEDPSGSAVPMDQ